MKTVAYKAFTHDLRAPLQGGLPVWDGSLPFTLPPVKVDHSYEECSFGWNACEDPRNTLRISRLWPNGFPIRLFQVETEHEVVTRGRKIRATSWDIVQEVPLEPVIGDLSRGWFREHADFMRDEQLQCLQAFVRPKNDREQVQKCLVEVLKLKQLDGWVLQEYPCSAALASARYEYEVCKEYHITYWSLQAYAGMDAVWDAWDTWVAGSCWAVGTHHSASLARAALSHTYAHEKHHVEEGSAYVTPAQGALFKEAFSNGLLVVTPVAHGKIGFVMYQPPNPKER